MSRSPLFVVLALGAVALVAVLGAARTVASSGPTASPDAMLPFLVAAGALCVVGLATRRQPSVAWLALIVALSAVTIDLASFGREQRSQFEPDAWRWVSITIVLSATFASSAAVGYASSPTRRIARWVPAAGVVAVAIVFAIGVWALATPDPEVAAGPPTSLGDLGLVTRAFFVSTAAFTILGILGDLRPVAHRASRQLAISTARPADVAGSLRFAVAWLRAFAEELAPGRRRARRAADAERARIARDLHAVVVPDLRRAIREAEQVGSVDGLATSLRDALRQVEAMIETRDSIGLEIGGLVPALESLAERVEDRSDVRVTIDVADGTDPTAGLPPPDVAAAALRVATLALENVTRHAPTASVRMLVASGPDRVRMTIEDDGPGLPVATDGRASANGHRGMIDMATEAELCGATLRTGRGDGGVGTLVAFDWPST